MKYQVRFPSMPLAVYRELVAHLGLVLGVEVGFLPQEDQQFDYNQSQIGGLWLQYREDAEPGARERVSGILAYYSDRYGTWEMVNLQGTEG